VVTSPAAALDPRAVATGALVAIVIAVPAATVGTSAIEDGSGGAIAFGLVALIGFLAGGWVAGWRQPDAPLANAAAAAFAGFAVAQAVALAVQASSDDAISVASIVVNALLATSVGLAGGWLADRRP
jgi:hypothetical protein